MNIKSVTRSENKPVMEALLEMCNHANSYNTNDYIRALGNIIGFKHCGSEVMTLLLHNGKKIQCEMKGKNIIMKSHLKKTEFQKEISNTDELIKFILNFE